ncbi:MAG: GSU2403 family nucleotidyltransferase fold protein, partial [Candidatus Aminicenantales bacterium]
MPDIRNTLNENLEFIRDQERLISARLALLPKGRIKAKKIGRETYQYLQYRKGKGFKSDYLGKAVPPELREQLKERVRLEKELRRVREGLRLLKSAPEKETDLTEPLRSILRTLTKEGLWESGLEIIGSWCFLLYQKHLPMERYPLKTEDLDVLIPLPFRGKSFDLGGYLKGLGFRQDFQADGSMSFSGNMMKVDFLSPEKGSGKRPPRFLPELAVTWR